MKCPKCDVEMKVIEFEGVETDECPKCGGIWVDKIEEKEVLNMEPAVFTMEDLQNFKRIYKTEWRDEKIKYFKCPRCTEVMTRKNYMHGSGIVIDKCQNHGTFFDKGELEKATEFVKKGGVEYEKMALTQRSIRDTHARLTGEINRVENTMYRLHWIGRFLSIIGF